MKEKKNNLTLSGTSSQSTTSSSKTTNTATSNAKSWTTYTPNKKLQKALTQAETNKPIYESQYENLINSNTNQILNRKAFQYDLNEDALYQQYAEQYKNLGNQAMQETMANASALSGGYANSYAATAGQQAYNSYLQQLNDIVPELYGQARANYNEETSELYNRANLLSTLESQDFAEYQAQLSQYNSDRDYAYSKYYNDLMASAVQHSKQTDMSTQTTNNSSSTSSSTYSAKNDDGSGGSGGGYNDERTVEIDITDLIKDYEGTGNKKALHANVQNRIENAGGNADGLMSYTEYKKALSRGTISGDAYTSWLDYISRFASGQIEAIGTGIY